jgi:hypothetical protein
VSRPTPSFVSSVSALVTLLTEKEDGHCVTFEAVIKAQIKSLRKQLDERAPKRDSANGQTSAEIFPQPSIEKKDPRLVLEALSQRLRSAENRTGPIFPKPDRDIRGLIDDLQRNGGSSWF